MNTQPSLNIQLWYFVFWYFDILYYNILYFLFLYFCVWASHPAKPGYPALIWTKQCPPGSYSTPASVSFLLMFFFIVLDSLHIFLFLGLSRNAWVRSLHCLVLSSKLTHWFMLLRLEWCDSGCWECFLPLVVWMLMMAHHSSLLTVCWEGGSSKNEDVGLGALITFLTMGHPDRIWLYFEPSEKQPEYHSYHLNPSLNMDQTKALRQ